MLVGLCPLGSFGPLLRLYKVRLQRFAVGFWTQRFSNLTGALLRAFGDVYAPSFEGVHMAFLRRYKCLQMIGYISVSTTPHRRGTFGGAACNGAHPASERGPPILMPEDGLGGARPTPAASQRGLRGASVVGRAPGPPSSIRGLVVTAMPAGAEDYPVLTDQPDAHVLCGHPVAFCGGLEHIRAEQVLEVRSNQCLVVVVYDLRSRRL